MLSINQTAPNFNLPDENGKLHSLEEFKGKKVVLYFYPKDLTSGCTAQGLAFKELYEEFQKENAVIIGISKDSSSSHLKFKQKYDFPFLLLSDESLTTIQAYEAWGEKSLYGRKYMGVIRSTYLIDEEGKLISIEKKVNPKENPACTLRIVQEKR